MSTVPVDPIEGGQDQPGLRHAVALMDDEFSAPAAVTPNPQPQSAAQPTTAQPDQSSEKKFRKEIDLGDGSGVQVFEADTPDELIDKLTEAQANATRKIRQLNQQLKQRTKSAPIVQPDKKKESPKKYEPIPLSEDEEFLLGQQFAQMPRKAFAKLFESVTGMRPSEFRSSIEQVHALRQAIDEAKAAEDFVVAHKDDYLPTPENFQQIQQFLDTNGLAITRQNLEYAFNTLSTSGLLDIPQVDEPASTTAQNQTARIEQPAPPAAPAAQPKPVSSGLSDRQGVRANVAQQTPTLSVDEIMRLPLEQARERILHAMHQQRVSQGVSQ